MGLRTLQNGELIFDDRFVPEDSLIGKEGQGMLIFGEGMEVERILLFGCHLGIMEVTLESCVRYAKERVSGEDR